MQAAESLRITAKDLLHFGLVDEILKEPLGGAHQNYDAMCETVKSCLARHLKELLKFSAKKRLSLRYNKFRNHGEFLEAPEPEQDLELEQAAEENKNVAKDDSSNPAPVVADVTDSEDESEVKADSTTVDQDSSQQAKDHAEVGSSELSSKES